MLNAFVSIKTDECLQQQESMRMKKEKKKQTRDPITICLLSVDLWWSTKELQTQWHERKKNTIVY